MANRFPKRLRLLRACDFDRVFAARSTAADASLVMHGAANGLEHARLGLVVSRRWGGAVERNRWKRLLREAFRLRQNELPPLDLVCIPRGQCPPSLETLEASLVQLAERIARRASDAKKRQPKRT